MGHQGNNSAGVSVRGNDRRRTPGASKWRRATRRKETETEGKTEHTQKSNKDKNEDKRKREQKQRKEPKRKLQQGADPKLPMEKKT